MVTKPLPRRVPVQAGQIRRFPEAARGAPAGTVAVHAASRYLALIERLGAEWRLGGHADSSFVAVRGVIERVTLTPRASSREPEIQVMESLPLSPTVFRP